MSAPTMSAAARAWVNALGLSENPAGGHYRQTFAAPFPDGESEHTKHRPLITVIEYLLSADAPIAWLHRTSADALHLFHAGAPLHVYILSPEGTLRREILGPDLAAGHVLQLLVPGGAWKAFELPTGDFSLIGEALVPGWIASDDQLADPDRLRAEFPSSWPPIARFVPGSQAPPESRLPLGEGKGEGGRNRPQPIDPLPPPLAVCDRLDPADLITRLRLAPNLEGGYYRQLYESIATTSTPRGPRPLANTIHYLLSRDSPLGHFHRNASDITHFLHAGRATYWMVRPDGVLVETVLGFDVASGEVLSFTCPGGWWKSSHLDADDDLCLISEIVTPGFRYDDHHMATRDQFSSQFPHLLERCRRYIQP